MRIKLSRYAKENDIDYMTAYRYFHNGLIKGIKMPNGTILIDVDNQIVNQNVKTNRVILYSRVSSSENKANAQSQLERLKLYAAAKGYTVVDEIIEIGSGLNDNRQKLSSILKRSDYDIILVEHKDRLARFGTNYIDILLNNSNKRIEVINEVTDDKEDIMQDFISIITSFSARIYGLRKSKRKTEQIIEQLSKTE